MKEQAKYFLKCLDSRNVEINNIDHAYNVVSVLEESTKLIKREFEMIEDKIAVVMPAYNEELAN